MEASLYRLAHQNSTMPSCAIVAPEDISYFSYYAAIPLTALIVIIQRSIFRRIDPEIRVAVWKLTLLVPITAFGTIEVWNLWTPESVWEAIQKSFGYGRGEGRLHMYFAIELALRFAITMSPSKRKGRGNVLLLIHHVVTNCLLAGAIYVGYHGVALLVLLIHNLSDLFLDTAQIIREKKMSDALLYPSFAVLLFFWVSTRLYTFPQILFYSYAYGAQQIHATSAWEAPWPYIVMMFAMLILQCLHVIWTAMMFASMFKQFSKDSQKEKEV